MIENLLAEGELDSVQEISINKPTLPLFSLFKYFQEILGFWKIYTPPLRTHSYIWDKNITSEISHLKNNDCLNDYSCSAI